MCTAATGISSGPWTHQASSWSLVSLSLCHFNFNIFLFYHFHPTSLNSLGTTLSCHQPLSNDGGLFITVQAASCFLSRLGGREKNDLKNFWWQFGRGGIVLADRFISRAHWAGQELQGEQNTRAMCGKSFRVIMLSFNNCNLCACKHNQGFRSVFFKYYAAAHECTLRNCQVCCEKWYNFT